ncbi:MAG: ATP-binding protein [bacterium]
MWELIPALWPLVAAMALLAVVRVRESRRRSRLNRALHELRRPLQALALGPPTGFRRGAAATPGSLDLALAALEDLDGAVNGTPAPTRPRPIAGRALISAAVERWRAPAARAGRSLKLEWRAGAAVVMADPSRVAQALDNLIANAIEHGGLRVRVEAALCAAGMRVVVANDGPAAGDRSPDPRRGHGLEVVREVAAAHGGRFALRSEGEATVAALELPLAPPPLSSAPIAA